MHAQCGAALKVGGHHVKCAAVVKEPSSNAGAAGRRNRKGVSACLAPHHVPSALPADMCSCLIAVPAQGHVV